VSNPQGGVGTSQSRRKEVTEMPLWALVLLTVLVVRLLTGGVGYGRR
jgi:hypothetical protein